MTTCKKGVGLGNVECIHKLVVKKGVGLSSADGLCIDCCKRLPEEEWVI